MNLDNIRKWVSALRSGRYKQGYRELQNGDRFCALGVAATTLCKGMIYDEVDYDDIRLALGVDEAFTDGIIDLNDDKVYTFEQIADYVEETCLNDKR